VLCVDVDVAGAWWTRTRVLFVVGKGGVGTSTVAAAIALRAADEGADVLLAAVDGKPGLGPLLGGRPLDGREQVLRSGARGRLRARTISPEQSFLDYLDLKGFGGVLRRVAAAASFDVIAGSTPGMRHLLVLGKVKELDRTRAADLIVVDAPPAGHAAPFLRSAAALQEAVASGPIRDQADEVAAMLADPDRTRCTMVTLAEDTPVSETIELAFDLEDRLHLALTPVVVNACWPDRPGLALTAATAARRQGIELPAAARRALDDTNRFARDRLAVQRAQLDRLARELPLEQVRLPRLPVARLLPEHLAALAEALG
jgi:arsenite-transporting ATPase